MPTKLQQDCNLARNILIYHELKKILKLFNESAIKTIVIGGAALAEKVYPDISLRPISDLDLLVKKDSLGLIDKILRRADYDLEIGRNDEIHYKNISPDFTIHIDLHSQLPYLDERGYDNIWARTVKTVLAGTDAHVLSPEDALIYAATDATVYHARPSHAALNDIALITRNSDRNIDWTEVINQIKRFRLEAPLYYIFQKANLSVNAGIPDEAIRAIKPTGKKALELSLYNIVLNQRSYSDRIGDDVVPILRFITRPYRTRLLQESFFPPEDFMNRRYGLMFNKMPYVFYLLRLMGNFWRITRTSINILTNA